VKKNNDETTRRICCWYKKRTVGDCTTTTSTQPYQDFHGLKASLRAPKIIHTPQWQFHGLDDSVQVAMGDKPRRLPFSYLSNLEATTFSNSINL
jgi:hypothetical protein